MVNNPKEYMAEWCKNNREKTKQYAKNFRKKHGPRILSEEEKEKQKEYMKDYQQANKDHFTNFQSLWKVDNRAKRDMYILPL